jgi:DNA-directed RNA polymerase subunit K/omega
MPPKKPVEKPVEKSVEKSIKKDEVILNMDDIEDKSKTPAKKIQIKNKPVVKSEVKPAEKPVEVEKQKTPEKKEVEKKEDKNRIKVVNSNKSSFDMFGEDDIDYRQILMNYDSSKNKTSPRITKYECSLMIGKRAEMIQQGANPNVKPLTGQSAIEIAEEELRQGKIPFIIKRPLGNTYEYWKPADMEIVMQ